MKYFFVLLFILNCNSSSYFKVLKPLKKDSGNFYLFREEKPFMSLYSYDIELYKYETHFKEENSPKIYKKINLKNGEYVFFNLQPSYYKIKLKDDSSTEKVFYINKNTEYFYEFYIFSVSDFTLPEYYFKVLPKNEALDILLGYGKHLKKDDLSED